MQEKKLWLVRKKKQEMSENQQMQCRDFMTLKIKENKNPEADCILGHLKSVPFLFSAMHPALNSQ